MLIKVDKVNISKWYEVNTIFDFSYIKGIDKFYSQKQNVLSGFF